MLSWFNTRGGSGGAEGFPIDEFAKF